METHSISAPGAFAPGLMFWAVQPFALGLLGHSHDSLHAHGFPSSSPLSPSRASFEAGIPGPGGTALAPVLAGLCASYGPRAGEFFSPLGLREPPTQEPILKIGGLKFYFWKVLKPHLSCQPLPCACAGLETSLLSARLALAAARPSRGPARERRPQAGPRVWSRHVTSFSVLPPGCRAAAEDERV